MAGRGCRRVPEALYPRLGDAGLRRGSVGPGVGAPGTGATSLVLALVAGPSASGSWVAAVGLPWLGLSAAVQRAVKVNAVRNGRNIVG